MHVPRSRPARRLAVTLFTAVTAILAACSGAPTPAPTGSAATPTASMKPAATSGPSGAAGTPAQIYDFGFDPNPLTVSAGTTVTWTNTGRRPHTVTADDGTFASENLGSGGTFTWTFTVAGTYPFHCTVHSDMIATVVVQ